ncbi:cation:proton antiporter [Candidatus Curtissbacteria bacterium]|nr:cation:proton antiporter [Candidatus Curtissbacteria bacterium]
MENIFSQLAVALSLSSLIGFITLKFKLPLVVAYLLAGVVISVLSLIDPGHSPVFEALPEIGIAFVLFLIGMELDLREIKSLGMPIIFSAVGQIFVSTLAGFVIATTLGFGPGVSLYLGLGLAFSSTVVVVKMLLEKRELASLHGKLSIGILLIEDLVAIVVLMFISVSESALGLGLQQSLPIIILILKAIGLFILTFLLSRFVLERVFDAVAKSVELLFLTAITWCFVFTTLAVVSGFSVVIGAFLAGVALASSPYHLQIQGKIKPLRDFFLTLFFVYLGLQANILDVLGYWPIILAFTVFAIVIKPLLYMFLLGTFGFRKHTIFQTGLNLSQVSEFSLVVLLVGVQAGLASQESLSVMAAVAICSIILSSIFISNSKRIYNIFKEFVVIFEHHSKIHLFETQQIEDLDDHVIVIGAHQVGGPVVNYLHREKIPVIVLDFNPHIVQEYRNRGVNIIYGDAGDPEILEGLQLGKSKLIISTANDLTDNEMIILEAKKRKSQATIVVRASDKEHAAILAELGADYVILPEQVSGDFLLSHLKLHWPKVRFPKNG